MRDHNNRRRRRNYHTRVNNLACAMVRGDVDSVTRHFGEMVRYSGKMDRRDCEEFLREFRAEMEEQTQSKQQLAVGEEKAKRRREMRELKKQMGL